MSLAGVRILDVFSGAGGLALGFLEATKPWGGRLVAAVDNDPSLEVVYTTNFPNTDFLVHTFSAIGSQDAEELPAALGLARGDIEVLIAGPPCQSFSAAGKRRPGQLDSRLALRVCDLARALRPRVVVIENVPEFLGAEDGRYVGRVRLQLAEAGYLTHVFTLNSASYGVPQSRTRSFVVAVALEAHRLHPLCSLGPSPRTSGPTKPHRGPLNVPRLPDAPTVCDAIEDLPVLSAGEGAEVLERSRATRSPYAQQLSKGAREIYNHVAVGHTEETVRALAALRAGETPQRDASHPLRRREYFRSAYARLAPDTVAPTMTTQTHNPGSGRFTHYSQDRVVTVREVARLQSFPDWFRFVGAPETQRRHVGNAVPPLLARALAEQLLPFLEPAE